MIAVFRSPFVRYAILPGFIPRLVRIFSSGFVHTAYLIAVIYESLRLLPQGHPFVNPQNIGRYGIRHVLAEAANNLVFSKKNIDQIAVFAMTLAGLVLLAMQFLLLVFAVVAEQPAFAFSPTDLFSVESQYGHGCADCVGPAQDLSFILMDRVFGTQNIFNSCIATDADCLDLRDNPLPKPDSYPFAFHLALHSMLRFYSFGIFIVSVLVLAYYVATIVGETAASGTPFGQRFNRAWAPVRLIVFFALLVPLNIGQDNAGLNAAQIITFWVSKTGSNFATNAWGLFNEKLTETYAGNQESLIATPNIPELRSLVQFMFVAKTCKIAENVRSDSVAQNVPKIPIEAYLIRENQIAKLVPGEDAVLLKTTDFNTAVKFVNYGNITIRFGRLDSTSDENKSYRGHVFPLCGDIKINISNTQTSLGSYKIQQVYYDLIQEMWRDESESWKYATCLVKQTVQSINKDNCTDNVDRNYAESQVSLYRNDVTTKISDLIQQEIENGQWNVSKQLRDKGWAGAAIWYNRLAEMNGQVSTAIFNMPQPVKYPYLMEHVAQQKRMKNENLATADLFTPEMADGEKMTYPRAGDEQFLPAMARAFYVWENAKFFEPNHTEVQGKIFVDAVNAIFGTSGIFEMRKNKDIHPLAQLSSLGKSMMEAALRNMAVGLVGGKASQMIEGFIGAAGGGISGFLGMVGKVTMAMSFTLFYVLPMLPFIYFIFGVSGWIKSIFEAIVAMPLWALAHLRIDGQGLPGPGATNGYFLLLEIFLRPVLLVFGLLASVIIFSSLVNVLNDVFDLVVENVSGANFEDSGLLTEFLRSPVDQFFYTVMYVIIVYMIAISCFKLIDAIPNKILRWAGVTVETFGESAGDTGGKLLSTSYSGTLLATNSVSGGALAAL
jgi:conjugal transfer/type IV secretion protein DotA/TraY